MKAMIDRSAEGGIENICIGMPHRGLCAAVELFLVYSQATVLSCNFMRTACAEHR